MLKHVLFLGPPGVGKGTYAKRVAPRLGFAHVSPGDLLREVSVHDPAVQYMLSQGQLLPEAQVFALMRKRLLELSNSVEGVILDGFPRNVEQAQAWIDRDRSRVPDLVVEFSLPHNLLVEKLIGRRVCSSCGDIYNVFSFNEGEFRMPAMLPKIAGKCDKCGSELVQRSDDSMDVVLKRLQHHENAKNALVDFIATKSANIIRFEVKTGISQLDELVSTLQHSI